MVWDAALEDARAALRALSPEQQQLASPWRRRAAAVGAAFTKARSRLSRMLGLRWGFHSRPSLTCHHLWCIDSASLLRKHHGKRVLLLRVTGNMHPLRMRLPMSTPMLCRHVPPAGCCASCCWAPWFPSSPASWPPAPPRCGTPPGRGRPAPRALPRCWSLGRCAWRCWRRTCVQPWALAPGRRSHTAGGSAVQPCGKPATVQGMESSWRCVRAVGVAAVVEVTRLPPQVFDFCSVLWQPVEASFQLLTTLNGV